jgi:hypothetical protein
MSCPNRSLHSLPSYRRNPVSSVLETSWIPGRATPDWIRGCRTRNDMRVVSRFLDQQDSSAVFKFFREELVRANQCPPLTMRD